MPVVQEGAPSQTFNSLKQMALFLKKKRKKDDIEFSSSAHWWETKAALKGTDGKSIGDKHAQDYFLALTYLLVTDGRYENLCIIWVDWPST